MVAREASLLPHTAQWAGVDGANDTTKSLSLVGKYGCPCQIVVKSTASHHAKRSNPGTFPPIVANSLFLRLDPSV